MNLPRVRRVAVVGAGIAGLSCATSLRHAGLAVTVYDKSRGPSGRMSTRRGEGWQCDHGAQYFTARSPQFRAELARWERAGAAARWDFRLEVFGREHAPDARAGIDRFVGTPAMNAPGKLLADALELCTGHTVSRLGRDAGGWRLDTREHGTIDAGFDAVVVAVPAPQANALVEGAAPALASLAARARMRASWAMMLRFDTRVDLPFDAAFVNQGPLRWIARDSAKPGRHGPETWLLHASAVWSEAHVDEEVERVAPRLLDAFAQLGGPAARDWSAHRWRHADTDPAMDAVCAWDADHAIGLCGDWLNGGKVEGAWLSGQALAQRVLVRDARR